VLVQGDDVVLLFETVLSYAFRGVCEGVFVKGLQVLLFAIGALERDHAGLDVFELGLEFGVGGLGRLDFGS